MDRTFADEIASLYSLLGKHPDENNSQIVARHLRTLEGMVYAGVREPKRLVPLLADLRRDARRLLQACGGQDFLATVNRIEALFFAEYQANASATPDNSTGVDITHTYFLSYARADEKSVDDFERLMAGYNRKVWRDQSGLRIGVDHQEAIANAITKCVTFVGLFGRHYHRSDYCKGELSLAMRRNREGLRPYRIALLRLDDTDPPLSYGTRTTRWARTWLERAEAARLLVSEESLCQGAGFGQR